MKQYAFYQSRFHAFYLTQNARILHIISMLIGPHITSLCGICLRILAKSWGNYGGIFGKFLKEVLEVFEQLFAHAYSFLCKQLPCPSEKGL